MLRFECVREQICADEAFLLQGLAYLYDGLGNIPKSILSRLKADKRLALREGLASDTSAWDAADTKISSHRTLFFIFHPILSYFSLSLIKGPQLQEMITRGAPSKSHFPLLCLMMYDFSFAPSLVTPRWRRGFTTFQVLLFCAAAASPHAKKLN